MRQAYAQNPYGNGLDEEPLRPGEIIFNDDGDEYEFEGISSGRIVVIRGGERYEMAPEEFSVEIV